MSFMGESSHGGSQERERTASNGEDLSMPIVVEGNGQAKAKADIHPWIAFLQSQSQTALNRLYSRPSSCLAIFRYVVDAMR
jgi:hypothetical protein